MELIFVPPELGRFDQMRADALLCGIFADERPLRGAAGLLDWRMCGMLSRLVRDGRLEGQGGEVLLFPAGRRLAVPRVLVFGLGEKAAFGESDFQRVAARMFEVALKLGAERVAVAPPGRAQGRLGARRALELLTEGMRTAEGAVRRAAASAVQALIVVDEPAAHKEMSELWRERRARPLAG